MRKAAASSAPPATFMAFPVTETVGVVVATYGDVEEWRPLARKATDSCEVQTIRPDSIIWWHGDSMADARNIGASLSQTDWLIFLDADDTLDERYVEEMLAGSGDLRQPSTLGVYPDGSTDNEPYLIQPKRNLLEGNHIVIGAMIRNSLFKEMGGFDDLPILEDWDLWIRCWLVGANITACPGAIYRVGVNDSGRNSSSAHGDVYTRIRAKYSVIARERGLL